MSSSFSAIVQWPDAPLTLSLIHKALAPFQISFIDAPTEDGANKKLLQWSTYDAMHHELIMARPTTVLASSYIFRKALIRKHFLSRIVHSFCVKNPESILKNAFPLTYELEISFADELDELWADDLWELSEALDSGNSWWILKPGMADRGAGIRLFNSKEMLQEIFEEFEDSDSEDDEDDEKVASDTAVVTSQLRHFVIQEYVPNPVLFDPREVSNKDLSLDTLEGHKFHLRVYCVANGALQVYVYDRILALFASVPYGEPTPQDNEDGAPLIDLQPHLTNTSLQTHRGEEGVRLLDDLVGCHILSSENRDHIFTKADHKSLIREVGKVLAETFKAALESSVHFQPIPNAFELYGVDFLVTHAPTGASAPLQLKLLELNAEPAIELTGPSLTWILEDMFKSIATICVRPFFEPEAAEQNWPVGEVRHHLSKCLDVSVRSWS